MMRWRDGVIHTDTPAKAVTVLLYLNTDSGPDQASLRILRSGDDMTITSPKSRRGSGRW